MGAVRMIDEDFLDRLRCPEDHSRLGLAGDELLARLNLAIAAGQIQNRGGHKVREPLSGGLVREDGTLLYPIVDDIPNLLIDEAIPLNQIV